MRTALLFSMAVALLGAPGCGSDEGGHDEDGAGAGAGHGGGHDGSGGGSGATGGGSGATGGDNGSGGGGGELTSAAPQAPTMDAAMPMDGALHVAWTNVTPDCDQIELDRNKDAGAFATAYTLTGEAVEHHDTEAVAPGTYCYVARCVKGAEVSADSNEVCGTP